MIFSTLIYTNLFVNYSSVKLKKIKEFISYIYYLQLIPTCSKFWELWLSPGQHLFPSRNDKPLYAFIQQVFFHFFVKRQFFS